MGVAQSGRSLPDVDNGELYCVPGVAAWQWSKCSIQTREVLSRNQRDLVCVGGLLEEAVGAVCGTGSEETSDTDVGSHVCFIERLGILS